MGRLARCSRYPVYLRVYDISDGAAAVWSPVLLWKKIDGVWHTGIHAYGYEYFYGGGILKMYPKDVEHCYNLKPKEILHLGYTTVPQSQFERFLGEISHEFSRQTYDLIKWNCNNFSDSCANFLLGEGIPERIVQLPEIVNKTLMGKVILRAMKAMRGTPPVGAEAPEERSERVAVETTRQRRLSVSPDLPSNGGGKDKSNSKEVFERARQRTRRFSCPDGDLVSPRNGIEHIDCHRTVMQPVGSNNRTVKQYS